MAYDPRAVKVSKSIKRVASTYINKAELTVVHVATAKINND